MASSSTGGVSGSSPIYRVGRKQSESVAEWASLDAGSFADLFQDERIVPAVSGWQCTQTGTNVTEIDVVAN